MLPIIALKYEASALVVAGITRGNFAAHDSIPGHLSRPRCQRGKKGWSPNCTPQAMPHIGACRLSDQ
jgi:hypothetical protein